MGPTGPQLYSIVSKGTVGELRSFLKDFPKTNMDEKTLNAETALYLSCARGSWDMALELLNHGAKAYGGCTQFQMTCLHWVFALDPPVQSTAVARLVQGGADIDAVTPRPVPFIHYPFSLPAGTPLHWAIATGSYTAIQALLDNEAKVTLRDGSDPYRYDERVRMLNSFGETLNDVYSFSEVGTQGPSPLDCAAMNFDPYIFEYLLSSERRREININDADEEGFTVLHRLSTSAVRCTNSGCSFSFLPFQGSPENLDDRLRRTVVAIKSLGGDFEKLTTPKASTAQKRQADGQELDFERYTPPMLAALGGWPRVVKALLEAGASAATENQQGNTALHCVSEDKRFTAETVRILVEAGAAPCHANRVGVTPLQRVAMRRSIGAMEILLSRGADIEDTNKMPRPTLKGSSIFAPLALKDYAADIFDETYDVEVAGLLEKHLLGCADEEKRMRVVRRCAPGHPGGTLLHRFAECFMRHSAAVLIQCGADVNATTTRYEFVQSPDCNRSVKVPRPETALDAAARAQAFHIKLMERDMRYTRPEHKHICMKADAVIMSLRNAGGIRLQGV